MWPKLAAIVIGLGLWQIVVWSGWKPSYLFPSPATVIHHLWEDRHAVISGILTTLRQAVLYFALALATGTLIGIAITRLNAVRVAVPSSSPAFSRCPRWPGCRSPSSCSGSSRKRCCS